MKHNSKTYIYDVGNSDKLRLQILNDIYNPMSKLALLDIGLRNMKCVVDMGCGQGEMTCWMAKQVMPGGFVFGIDSSSEQLSLASARAQIEGIENIQFIQHSVLDKNFSNIVNKFSNKPDLLYSRWLLIHIEKNKLRKVMRRLYDFLSPGGIAAHEEVALNKSSSKSEPFKVYLELFKKLSQKLNISFDVGSDLTNLFDDVGYLKVKNKVFKPIYTKDQLYFFQLDLESALPAFIKFGIASESFIYKLNSDIENHVNEGIDMSMTNYFVYGVK